MQDKLYKFRMLYNRSWLSFQRRMCRLLAFNAPTSLDLQSKIPIVLVLNVHLKCIG